MPENVPTASAVPQRPKFDWPANTRVPQQYRSFFEEAGSRYNVDPTLLAAVAGHESRFNPAAKSPVGAMGLMQVMPNTAAGMGAEFSNLADPRTNIMAGANYLSQMLKSSGGDIDLALAQYHSGPGFKQLGPYGMNYAPKVADQYGQLFGDFRPGWAQTGTGGAPFPMQTAPQQDFQLSIPRDPNIPAAGPAPAPAQMGMAGMFGAPETMGMSLQPPPPEPPAPLGHVNETQLTTPQSTQDDMLIGSWADSKRDEEEANRLAQLINSGQMDDNPALPMIGQLYMQKMTFKGVASMFKGMDPRMVAGFAAALAGSFMNPMVGMAWGQQQQQRQVDERQAALDRQGKIDEVRERNRGRVEQRKNDLENRNKARYEGFYNQAAREGVLSPEDMVPTNTQEFEGLARKVSANRANMAKTKQERQARLDEARKELDDLRALKMRKELDENDDKWLEKKVDSMYRELSDLAQEAASVTGVDWLSRMRAIDDKRERIRLEINNLTRELNSRKERPTSFTGGGLKTDEKGRQYPGGFGQGGIAPPAGQGGTKPKTFGDIFDEGVNEVEFAE